GPRQPFADRTSVTRERAGTGVENLAVLQPAELGLIDARTGRDLIEAQARGFALLAERSDESLKSFHVDFRGGCGRDRSGRAVLAIQGLAVPLFPLPIFGRLDASERGLRSGPLLGREGGQRLARALGKSSWSIGIIPHILEPGNPSRVG